jgi:hypothetical protein
MQGMLFMANHNIQSNRMQYIFSRHFILQHPVGHSYMFRPPMRSSSGNHIKVTLHKTKLAIHVQNKKIIIIIIIIYYNWVFTRWQ